MKAIFCVPFQVGLGPVLPPKSRAMSNGAISDPLADITLDYDDKGTLSGGYSCIGHVSNRKTCLVLIHASKDTIDAMAASPDYLHILDDGAAGPVALVNTKAWLTTQGHDTKELDKQDFTDKQKALLRLHQVTDQEYTAGRTDMAPNDAAYTPTPSQRPGKDRGDVDILNPS